MKKIIFIIFLLSVVCGYSVGQNSDEEAQIPQITPVSPNAASLGIFGAIPVGYYTGVPDISIPVYEINFEGKSIPIKLSYHASGIKVSQESSAVGLGWALNAGGCIIREMRGSDDFTYSPTRGYYYDTDFPHANSNNDVDPNYPNDIYKYKSYQKNEADSEPDLFHFNFASYSGTVFFDKENAPGNSRTQAKGIVRKESAYLDVTLDLKTYDPSFKIIDGDGFTYYFSPREWSKTYTAQSSDYKSSISKEIFSQRSPTPDITAWYLDSIVAPNKKKMAFFYAVENIVTPISVTEDVSYMIDGRGGQGMKGVYSFYSYSYTECSQARVTQITFDKSDITFGYGDRADLETLAGSANKARKLETITVRNANCEVVKSIDLQQSYLGNPSNSLQCRLKLDAVNVNSHAANPELYQLFYNEGSLPSKNSISCDYWGYYNGSTLPVGDKTFKLSPSLYLERNDRIHAFPGLNKRVDTTYVQYGILKEMIYPTGGRTVFDFETHEFRNSISEFKKSRFINFPFIELTSPSYNYTTETFEISASTKTTLEIQFNPLKPESGYPYPSIYVYIEKKEPTGSYSNFKTYYYETDASSYFNNTGSNIYKEDLILPPGTYFFDIRNNHQGWQKSTVNITAEAIVEEQVNQGGGLRIKSITNYTGNNVSTRQIFSYQSGILMTPPVHHSQYILQENVFTILPAGRPVYESFKALYVNGYSTPYTPFSSSAQGGHVGYTYVEEKTVDTGNANSHTGTISYKFTNIADDNSNLSDRLIKGFPAISNQDNGNLLEITYYDANMNPRKRKTFGYSYFKGPYNVKAVKVFQMPMVTENELTIKFYDLFNETWYLSKIIDEEYNETSTIPVTTVTEFRFNTANHLANYEKITDGKNNIIEKNIKYPLDFNTSLENEMKSKHLVNTPLEVITYNNGSENSRIKTVFYKTNGLILPHQTLTSTTGESGLEAKITFDRYDDEGNILQYTTPDDITHIYIWGYNNSYPIAEIKNVSYATAEAAIKSVFSVQNIDALANQVLPDETKLINGSLQQALPTALVTTYTYSPLVGLSTVTNPQGFITIYHYDNCGRLEKTSYRDKDNNNCLLEKYQYKYKTQ